MLTDEARAQAREFIESVRWQAVRGDPEGPLNKPPDPHQYVILGWESVDTEQFWWFVDHIRGHGYRGKYTAPYNNRALYNRYFELDGFVYWFIRPMMLNRTRVEYSSTSACPIHPSRPSCSESNLARSRGCWHRRRPATLRRLFDHFELLQWPSLGKGSETGSVVFQGEAPTVERGGQTFLLIPYVHPEALNLDADEFPALKRSALALSGNGDNALPTWSLSEAPFAPIPVEAGGAR